MANAPQGQSTRAGQNVDPDTGNFTSSYSLFSDPTVGGADLGVTLTYNSGLAQTESLSNLTWFGTSMFGFGWESNQFPSVSPASDGSSVTVNEENGAQVKFTPASSTSTSCDGGTTTAWQFTDNSLITSSQAYCAAARVDAQLGYFNGHYYFTENSARKVVIFDPYQFPSGYSVDAYGPNTGNGWVSAQYYVDIAPGSQLTEPNGGPTLTVCPSNTSYVCDAIVDGSNNINSSVPDRFTTFQLTALGNVYNIIDPSGASYPLTEDTSRSNLTQIATPQGSWQFAYDTGQASPYAHDLYTITSPNGNNTSIRTLVDYNLGAGQTYVVATPGFGETDYYYANTACSPCGNGQVPNQQRTYVYFADGEVDYDYYVGGLLVGSNFGSSTVNSAFYDTVSFNYNLPTTSNPTAPNVLTVVSPADSGGTMRSTTVTTNDVGDVLSVTDVNGNTTTNFYDSTNHFDDPCWSAGPGVAIPPSPSCSSPPPGSTAFTYDQYGNETSRTDPLGNTTHYAYNPVWITSNGTPTNAITDQLCWSAPPSVTVPSGATCASPPTGATVYSYDQYGNVASKTVASGTPQAQTWSATYDVLDRMLTSVPPNGNASGANPASYQTTYHYYPTGSGGNSQRLQTVTAPGNRTTSYSYDADGNVLSETDPAGATSGAYDAIDRLCWSDRASSVVSAACGSPPSGATVTSYFTDTTAPSQVTDPNGKMTSYQYNDPRFPTSPTKITDPMGVAPVYDYYDPGGNRCVSGPVSPSGCVSVTGDSYAVYDGFGNVQETIDPSGVVTYLAHADAAYPNVLTSVWGPATTPKLPSTADYSYDADGHRVLSTDASGNSISTAYNVNGQECWQAPGVDAPNCAAPPSGTGVSGFSYYPNGLHSQMTDNLGTPQQATSSYSYDASGNLLSAIDDNGKTVSYQYDASNDLTCIAYPVVAGSNCAQPASSANTVVNRTPDSAGRLASTTDWLGNIVSYSYDAKNDVTNISYKAGSSTVESVGYSYDAGQNLRQVSFTGSVPGTSTETWTPNNDELVGSTSQLAGYSSSFSYNQYNQVTQATNPGSSSADSYTYANDGTIQQDTPPGQSATTYSYNAVNELTTLTNPAASTTTSYAYTTDGQRCWSASGNISSPSCVSAPNGATSYAWNAYGSLCWSGPATSNAVCSAPPSGSTTYAYDGTGLRVAETPPSGSPLTFTWDRTAGAGVPSLLSDGTNAYVDGPAMFGSSVPEEQISLSSGQVSFLTSVPSGVQLAFSSGGALLNRSSYSTYGSESNSNQAASPFGFQGSYTDPSGLVYLINRYYDPSAAQFLSVDPLVQKTGQPYEFAGDNPINGTDPLGLCIKGPPDAPPVNCFGKPVPYNSSPSPTPTPPPGPPASAPSRSSSQPTVASGISLPDLSLAGVAPSPDASVPDQLPSISLYQQAVIDYIALAPYYPTPSIAECELKKIAFGQGIEEAGGSVAEQFATHGASLAIRGVSLFVTPFEISYDIAFEC